MGSLKSKRWSRLAGWACALCFAQGAILLASFFVLEAASTQRTSLALREFERDRRANAGHPAAKWERAVAQVDDAPHARDAPVLRSLDASPAFPPDRTLWSPERIRQYEDATAAADLTAEGILRIDAVGVRVPIFDGTSDAILDVGAGRIEGMPPLGTADNIGIAAHRDGHFRALKDIEIGAELIVETLHGSYRYEVFATSIVSPDDVYVLDPAPEARLTLVTCYPFYFVGNAPQRFIVHARGVDGTASTEQ